MALLRFAQWLNNTSPDVSLRADRGFHQGKRALNGTGWKGVGEPELVFSDQSEETLAAEAEGIE